MSDLKFILFGLAIITSLSIVKRKHSPRVVTKIIEPTKHYTDEAPWYKFTTDEIIDNDYPKRGKY